MGITQKSLKEFFKNLEDINYYVFGGIALDSIKGYLTREHDDVDLIVDLSNKNLLIERLKQKGFVVEIDEEGLIKLKKRNFKVDILVFFKKSNKIFIDGRRAKIEIPFDFFKEENIGQVGDLKFKIVPKEFLVRTILYYNNEKDRMFLISLSKNLDLNRIKKIKYLCKRDSKDLKLKKIRIRNQKLEKNYGINFLTFERLALRNNNKNEI
jgi:hypothetical protein